MTTMKIGDKPKKGLSALKTLLGLKSYSEVVETLVNKELSNYCFTQDGYAKEGDSLLIDGNIYFISAISGDIVYARCEHTVIEFHKGGRTAWRANKYEE